jgi:exocyst complex component 7
MLSPILTLFTSTFASASSLIKRSLHKYTFLALSVYSSISVAQNRWEALITQHANRKDNELKDVLSGIRSMCLRSFPEFLADIKLAAVGKSTESTGLIDFVITVCAYSLISYARRIDKD